MADQVSLLSDEKALQVAQALLTLAEINGLRINITIPEKPNTDPHPPVEEANFVDERQREDFAWLQAELTQRSDTFARLRGNYVAVYRKRIISIGEDKYLVLQGAASDLGVEPDEILVLPVCVEGPDANDDWQMTKAQLGIA
jgi:hypothetical protein